jgi:hypothetical protein
MKYQNKAKSILFSCLAMACAAALTSCMSPVGNGTSVNECVNYVGSQGSNSSSCLGNYYGFAKMTNVTGSIWITPPTNTVTGTFTNLSIIDTNATYTLYVMQRNDGVCWCATNSVTFPATNPAQYSLSMYVKGAKSSITNGQPFILQINWN